MSRSAMALAFLIVGLLCIGVAAILHFNRPIPVVADIVASAQQKGLSTKEQNLEKGRLFEEYLLQRIMDLPAVSLIGRNADYVKNNIRAEENSQPDLRFRKDGKAFAIECKWRRDFFKDRIDWANDFQIRNYNEFQQTQKMPVLVALGIGGKPDLPHELYLLPLSRLKYTTATRQYLQPFLVSDEVALVGYITSYIK